MYSIFNVLEKELLNSLELETKKINTTVCPNSRLENENEILLLLHCYGTKKEDIEIKIIDNNIKITGKREKPENYEIIYEFGKFHYGTWEYNYTIKNDFDIDKIEVEYNNGVLEIKIPRKQKQSKTISIK